MKYRLTEETTVSPKGTTLYRIEALSDIPRCGVVVGDLGGFVESEENLSQEGNAWIYDDAQVSQEAHVWSNAQVMNNAQVFGSAQVFGGARVSEGARVYGDAKVHGDADVQGEVSEDPICITGGYWPITILDKQMRIGCQFHDLDKWAAMGDRFMLKEGGSMGLRLWRTNKAWILKLRDWEWEAGDHVFS